MRSKLCSFSRDENGAIAIIFALTLTIVCVCVGGAIDFARYTSAKTQTAAALDAAVLAGARTLLLGGNAATAKAAAQDYYARNVTDRFAVSSDTVSFNVTNNDTAITGTGNALLPATFLKLAGINSFPLVSNPGADFPMAQINGGGGGDIEVSVMLDVTGSMCDDGKGPCTSGTKLNALKAGANDLVNIVVQTDQSEFKTRVALIPFSRRIRVAPNNQGGSIMQSLTGLNPTWSGWKENCTNWTFVSAGSGPESSDNHSCDGYELEQVTNWKIRPCVTERYFESTSTLDATDDAPGNNAWLNAHDGRRGPISLDSASTPPTSGIGATSSDPATHDVYSDSGWCRTPESNEIVPLSADKPTLQSKINGLEASEQTAGALGTAFSWYMLSPKWNSIWPSSSAADPYAHLTTIQTNGKPKLRKVAVLMSDGVFNTYRSWTGQNQQEVSDYAKSICTAMKAAGIEIYTIGFDLDSLSSAERAIAIDTLQSCGTDIEHFYNTLTPEDLQGAFQQIAVTLSSISLSQ